MSDSFDRLIAERLDISEEKAGALLRTMLKELRARAREEGVRLPELGTFREENGTLSFTPSASLRRRVNLEYEGLSAEELAPASDPEPQEEVPPFLDHPDDRFRTDLEEPEPEPDLETREESSPVVGPPARKSAEPQGAPIPAEEAEETSPIEGAAPVTPEETPPSESAPSQSPDSFHYILGFLLLVFLLGAGWFVFSETGILSTGPGAVLTSGRSSGTGTAGSPAAGDTTMTQTAPADTVATDSSSTGDTAPSSDSTNNQTGINPEAGGWTIVVASTIDRATADSLLNVYTDRFSDTDFPVDMLSATVENQTRYRVGVGQHKAQESVLDALDQHASKLPDGAWVLRLR